MQLRHFTSCSYAIRESFASINEEIDNRYPVRIERFFSLPAHSSGQSGALVSGLGSYLIIIKGYIHYM